jgi:hypothetical protein
MEMSSKKKFSTRMKMAVGAVAAALVILPTSAAVANAHSSAPVSTKVNWQIALRHSTAYPRATGSAQYQTQPGQREFQAEVDHIRSLAGSRVTVKVNGSVVARPKVSALGHAQLTRNTELGQAVPKIVHGSKVAIQTGGGVRIVSGTF